MTGSVLRRRMSARDPHESHRVSTPLELLFDLVFVVAIASAAALWHHAIAEGHPGELVNFLFAFFGIWWAWMNYTWFASAYDTGDVGYRLLTFVIMTGALMFAAAVPDLFADGQSVLGVAGYAVMRLGMVAFWLRAAAGDPSGRSTALKYAVGITTVQVFWIARLAIDDPQWRIITFLIGIVLELSVPLFAERRAKTPFHPEHIAERYSLFTIIVLGEVILATVGAVQGALEKGVSTELLDVVGGGLLIVFSLWWIYFKHDHVELFEGRLRDNLLAGYGHVFVFMAVASTGAALSASVDLVTGEAHASSRFVALVLAGSLAVYLLTLAVFRALAERALWPLASGAATAASVVVIALLGLSIGLTVLLIGLALAVAVAVHVVRDRDGAPQSDPHSTGESSPVSTS